MRDLRSRRVAYFAAAFLASVLFCSAEQPELWPLGLQMPATIAASPNPQITVTCALTNSGDMPALDSWRDQVYFSTTNVLDGSAVPLNTRYHWSWLEELMSEKYELTVTVPVNQPGVYYLLFKVDSENAISEYDESNNVIARAFTFSPQYPDLVVADLQIPDPLNAPLPCELPYQITFGNAGQFATSQPWRNAFFFSSDATLDPGDEYLTDFYVYSPVAPGGTVTSEGVLRIYSITGPTNGYLIVQADGANDLFDVNPANNVIARPFTFQLTPPDLQPGGLSLTNSSLVVLPYPEVTVSWWITNHGAGNFGDFPWSHAYYFSSNAVFSLADATRITGGWRWGPLPAGAASSISETITLPVQSSGNYFLYVLADDNDGVVEANETNNVAVLPLSIEVRKADLAILPGLVSTNLYAPRNPPIQFAVTGTNTGTVTAAGFYTGVYSSTDPVLDDNDTTLATQWRMEPVPPGGSWSYSGEARLPVTASGRYYLIAQVNAGEYLAEANVQDNVWVTALDITVLPADLVATTLSAPTVYQGPPLGLMQLSYTITNSGPVAAISDWYWEDRIFISTNGVLDANSRLLWTGTETGPVTPGQAYTRTVNVNVPAGYSGACTLFLKVNADSSLWEVSTANNVFSRPVRLNIVFPDLLPVPAIVPATLTGPPNPQLVLDWGVTNAGLGAAIGLCFHKIVFSPDSTYDQWLDAPLVDRVDWDPLPAGSVRMFQDVAVLPVQTSTNGYIIFVANSSQYVSETDFANNVIVSPISITVEKPDLTSLQPQVQPIVDGPPKPYVTVVWGVTNQGPGAAVFYGMQGASGLFLSRNNRYDYWDRPINSGLIPTILPNGGAVWFTNHVALPADIGGAWHIVAYADPAEQLIETDETNNSSPGTPVQLNITYPDLAVTAIHAPAHLVYSPNEPIGLIIGRTNIGMVAMLPSYLNTWRDRVWISPTPEPGPDAVLIAEENLSLELQPGQGYERTYNNPLPLTTNGTYYVIASAGEDLLYDANTNNNLVSLPITVEIARADLQPILLNAPATIISTPSPQVEFSLVVTNRGPGTAYPSSGSSRLDALFLSLDPVLDTNDIALTSFGYWVAQSPGTALTNWYNLRLPVNASGVYYLLAVADRDGTVPESDESNNVLVRALNITITPPDLAPVHFDLPPVLSGPPLPWAEVVYAVTNAGPGAALREFPWYDAVYWADVPEANRDETKFALPYYERDLPAGGVYWRTNYVRLPFTNSGAYQVVLEANTSDSLYEATRANNTITNRIEFTAVMPDLAVVRLTAPTTVSLPETSYVPVSWGITNLGPGIAAAYPYWQDQVFLSQDPVLSQDDQPLATHYSFHPMLPGTTRWQTETAYLPDLPPGLYYLILSVNDNGGVVEISRTNNVAAAPLVVQERKPDLSVVALETPALITNPFQQLTVAWWVTNVGPGAVRRDAAWYDCAYLSPTPNMTDPQTKQLEWLQHRAPLSAGSSYRATNTVSIESSEDGDFYLVLRAGQWAELNEVSTENNTLAVPVQVRLARPDLALAGVHAPGNVTVSPEHRVEVAWAITNAGPGATRYDQPIETRVFFSTDPGYSGSPIASAECPPLAPGEVAWVTNRLQLPIAASGTVYLTLLIDPDSNQAEVTSTNNTAVWPVSVELVRPDLAVTDLITASNIVYSPNQPIQIAYALTNLGPGNAMSNYTVYLSLTNASWLGAYEVPLCTGCGVREPGEFAWRTNFVRLPNMQTGLFYLTVHANPWSAGTEIDTNNNAITLPVWLECRLADLSLTASMISTNPPGAIPPAFDLAWAVTNIGPGTYFPRDQLQLTVRPYYGQPLMDRVFTEPVPPGGVLQGTNTIQFQQNWPGPQHYEVRVESEQYTQELDLENNSQRLVWTEDCLPDLAIMDFIAPTTITGAPNQVIVLALKVSNLGPGTQRPGWSVWVSLASPYTGFQEMLPLMSHTPINQPLPPGQSRWFTNTVRLPAGDSGNFRYCVYASGANNQDADYQNNERFFPVRISISRPSQLRAHSLSVSAQSTASNAVANCSWSVLNEGDGPTEAAWADCIYYSEDAIFSWDDVLLLSMTNAAGFASGVSYVRTADLVLPAVARDDSFLLLRVDRYFELFDEDRYNNDRSTLLRIQPETPAQISLAQPHLSPDGTFRFMLHGKAGQTATVQVSTNLVEWSALRSAVLEADALVIQDPAATNHAARFYRAVAP